MRLRLQVSTPRLWNEGSPRGRSSSRRGSRRPSPRRRRAQPRERRACRQSDHGVDPTLREHRHRRRVRLVGPDEVEDDVGANAIRGVADVVEGRHNESAPSSVASARRRSSVSTATIAEPLRTRTSCSAMCPTPPMPISAVVVPARAAAADAHRVVAVSPASACGATSAGSTPSGSDSSDRSSTEHEVREPAVARDPGELCRAQCMSRPRRQETHSPQLYGG